MARYVEGEPCGKVDEGRKAAHTVGERRAKPTIRSRSSVSVMAIPGPKQPWCPNCKSPIGPQDFGVLSQPTYRSYGYTIIDPAIVYCKKCGVILGAQAGDTQAAP